MLKKDIKPSDVREDMKKLIQKGLTYHQIADKLGFDTLADGFRPLFYELEDQHKKGVLLESVDSLIKEGTKKKQKSTKTKTDLEESAKGIKKKPRGTKTKVGSVLKEKAEDHSVQDEFKSLVSAEKAKQTNKEPELEDINLDDIKLVGDTTLVLDGDTKVNKKEYNSLLVKLDEIIMLETELEIIQSKLKTKIIELKKGIKNA